MKLMCKSRSKTLFIQLTYCMKSRGFRNEKVKPSLWPFSKSRIHTHTHVVSLLIITFCLPNDKIRAKFFEKLEFSDSILRIRRSNVTVHEERGGRYTKT